MLVIYGIRPYGKAARIDDEYAITRWIHLWFVPLIPVSSRWIAADSETPITMNARSVGIVYGRLAAIVGIIVGIALFAGGSTRSLGVLAVALALGYWSLGWGAASARERARANFHRGIYGTACPPAWLPAAVRAQVRATLGERWRAIGGGRTPQDVARLGARSPREAMTAYMLLSLTGAAADADRIVAGEAEPARFDGPYRSRVG